MSVNISKEVAALLQEIRDLSSPKVISTISTLVRDAKDDLVSAFYDYMLTDEQAAKFLSVTSVEQRLKPGLERWLLSLLCHDDMESLKTSMALQRHVGEVHARAEIPVALVSKGMRLLKKEIFAKLIETSLTRDDLIEAVLRVDRLMDIAFEVMSEAYASSHEYGIRTDESFRLFSAGHNLAMEKEKQHGAVLEWENRLFRSMASDWLVDNVMPLNSSAFGLWLRHKAPVMFGEIHELPVLEACIDRIDNALLPQITLNDTDQSRQWIRELVKSILSETEQIKYLLNGMFERLTEMEVGRDVLTQLFNRRFLPTILKRELELVRRNGKQCSVLMIDVDHFKSVNDKYGHEAGDRILQQVAAMIMNKVRAGDFAFRYGGEEFLMVLTEVDLDQAKAVAEKIRQHVQDANMMLADNQTIHVTISLGIAMTDGHPDYQRLIDRADAALYQAKKAGRNCCVSA